MKQNLQVNITVFIILLIWTPYTLCFGNEFGMCIKSETSPSLKSCFGQEIIKTLSSFESSLNYEVSEGIVFEKDDSVMSRSVPNFLEQDPMDYR